ncbi:MAG TPA: CsgG/HfaB family protein [Allosphingosinicella sp.]|jgi:curli biogenesis system outer membrane secretion channel CsgG
MIMQKRWLLLVLAFVLFPSAVLAQPHGKPVVAIYQIEDVAHSGQAEAFSAMIETAIEATGKFRVIERSHLNTLVGEQARARSGLLTTNHPGKIGGFEGADYLVYGSITSVSAATKTNIAASLLGGVISGTRNSNVTCNNTYVTIGVDIKITDASSGEVKYVTRINDTQKSTTACGGSGQIDAGALLRSAAEKVASGLVTAIYPIQIAAVQTDGTIVLNYGEGTVQANQVFGIYSKGNAIIDPATGDAIGNDEQKLGFIRIVDVSGRLSRAVAVSPFASPPPIGSIARLANPSDLQALNGTRKRR